MSRKKMVPFLICLALLAAGSVLHPLQAQAGKTSAEDSQTLTDEEETETKTEYIKGVNKGWVKRDGYVYYYRDGKPLKGFKKIRGKYYYFDRYGRQRTGWRKVKKKFRYFRIRNGRKGYMLSGVKINGVKLKKNGTARITNRVKKKVDLLLRYQKLVDQMTVPLEDNHTKLVRVFKYARDLNLKDLGDPTYAWNWDQIYAEMFLQSRYGDCVVASCGFAYMANAIGYENVSVRLYFHSHAEINKRIYDPGFAKTVSDYNYTQYFDRAYSDLPDWGTFPGINTRFI